MDTKIVGPACWHFLDGIAAKFDRSNDSNGASYYRSLIQSLAFCFPCAKCRMRFTETLLSSDLKTAIKQKHLQRYIYDCHNAINFKKKRFCKEDFVELAEESFEKDFGKFTLELLYSNHFIGVIKNDQVPEFKDYMKQKHILNERTVWDFVGSVAVGLSLNKEAILPEYQLFFESVLIVLNGQMSTEIKSMFKRFKKLNHRNASECLSWCYELRKSVHHENIRKFLDEFTIVLDKGPTADEIGDEQKWEYWIGVAKDLNKLHNIQPLESFEAFEKRIKSYIV